MDIKDHITARVREAVKKIFDADLETVELQPTRKDFEGDITVVVFPMLRLLKGNPQAIGEQIGSYLETHVAEIDRFNVVKGFLNLVICDDYYLDFLEVSASRSNTDMSLPIRRGKPSWSNILRPIPISRCTWGISGITFSDIRLRKF